VSRKQTVPPIAYVVEGKWEGTSHKWEPLSGVPAFNYQDDAMKHLNLLRKEKPTAFGLPMAYRLATYVRDAVVIEP
jgi:hypothetical protein